MPSKFGSITTIAALAVGSTVLAACGSSPKAAASAVYVPLTQANLSSAMAAAIKNKHTVREVTTSSSGISTVDFDSSGKELKWQITEVLAKTKKTPRTTIQVILIGDVLYARKLPGKTGGKWLKYSTTEAGLSSSVATGQVDPSSMVAKFSKGIKSFKYLGATQLGGAPVEQYSLTLDAATLTGTTSSSNLGAESTVGESIYLNKDNSLRRMVLTLPGGVGNTQIDFTGWGQPSTIAAPPAADTQAAKK